MVKIVQNIRILCKHSCFKSKKKKKDKKKKKKKKKKKSLEEFSIYIWCCMTRIIPIALCPELYCKKFLILATISSHFPQSFPVHFHILWMYYNHSQKLWHKPPSLSFNVDFLSFRSARCTRQPSEQFQTIFTLSQHWWGRGEGCKHIFLRKKVFVPQYFVTDCLKF